MAITNGIKLAEGSLTTKAIAVIRKSTDCSIAEIKNRVNNNEYVIEYESTDNKGLARILRLYHALQELGCEPQLFHRDILRPLSFFENMQDARSDTARQLGIPEEDWF